MCASSRNSAFYQDFLQLEEQANPEGMIYVITDNLSSHDSKSTRAWLEDHPRIRHAFIPKGACWLNLQEGWWRIFRRQALAGQSFADPDEIAHATQVATAQLNAAPGPGSGDGPSPSHAPTAGALCTPFKELSTSRASRARTGEGGKIESSLT
jgi:DDE superfamily endonuclease